MTVRNKPLSFTINIKFFLKKCFEKASPDQNFLK